MAKYYKVTGTITEVTRLNSSVNGNPRFTLVIDGKMLTTKSDYMYNYNIDNLYRKGCKVIATCYDTKCYNKIEDIKEFKEEEY